MKQYTHLVTEHYIYYLVNSEFLSNTDLFPNKAYEVYDNTSIEHKGKDYYIFKYKLTKKLKWIKKMLNKYINSSDKDYLESISIYNELKHEGTIGYELTDKNNNVKLVLIFFSEKQFKDDEDIFKEVGKRTNIDRFNQLNVKPIVEQYKDLIVCVLEKNKKVNKLT
jgi:hypothetical protein